MAPCAQASPLHRHFCLTALPHVPRKARAPANLFGGRRGVSAASLPTCVSSASVVASLARGSGGAPTIATSLPRAATAAAPASLRWHSLPRVRPPRTPRPARVAPAPFRLWAYSCPGWRHARDTCAHCPLGADCTQRALRVSSFLLVAAVSVGRSFARSAARSSASFSSPLLLLPCSCFLSPHPTLLPGRPAASLLYTGPPASDWIGLPSAESHQPFRA